MLPMIQDRDVSLLLSQLMVLMSRGCTSSHGCHKPPRPVTRDKPHLNLANGIFAAAAQHLKIGGMTKVILEALLTMLRC